ncbi:MAG: DUF1365 domain-containing protein [Psychrobium sp.]
MSQRPIIQESGIYTGKVRHRRFSPVARTFCYSFSMFGLNPDAINQATKQHFLFGTRWFNPVRFCEKDYIKSEPGNLKQRIASKVAKLGGDWQGNQVMMLVQCRSLGLYFSPVNLFFCFNDDGSCRLMLAEVSNTPWQERHYYLVDVEQPRLTQKDFHVSPFMPLDMQYKWRVKPPSDKLFVHLENLDKSPQAAKVFDATMALEKQPMSSLAMIKTWFSLPFAAIKIVSLIYWQALKIFIGGVPFIPHPKQ